MAITFKKEDDLEKMFEEFATIEALEEVEFPDPKSKKTSQQNDKEDVK